MKNKHQMSTREKRQMRWGYFFIGPAIIGLFLFNFGPMLFSLGISFTKWDVLTPKELIGLDNYIKMFHDPLVIQAIKVTLIYTLITVPLVTCVPLLIAILLYTKVKGISVFSGYFLCTVDCSSGCKFRGLDVYL